MHKNNEMSGVKYYIAIPIQYTAECSHAAAATAARVHDLLARNGTSRYGSFVPALCFLSVLFFSTKMNVATIMSRICMPWGCIRRYGLCPRKPKNPSDRPWYSAIMVLLPSFNRSWVRDHKSHSIGIFMNLCIFEDATYRRCM